MKSFGRLTTLVILLVLSNFVFSREAYAYIDPGSGSYILQLAIAALLGGLYAIKVFYRSITTFITSLFESKRDEKDAD